MKKTIIILTIFILLFSSINNAQKTTIKNNIDLPEKFIIENITSIDGGYHKSKRISIEWWYFDANFDNNYSVQIGFMLVSKNNIGVVVPGINIYENGINIFHKRKIIPMKNFKASEKKPLIYLNEEEFINGTINNETGIASYYVSLKVDNAAVNLKFDSIMRGYKTTNWAIIMPKADVSGNIKLNDETINVNGEGYHEHKWNLLPSFAINNKGYYWGRIGSNNTNLVWIEFENRRQGERTLAVLNIGKDKYVKINPEDFEFEITGYQDEGIKKIPDEFKIQIKNETIEMNITINAIDVHFVNGILIKYWRYNVETIGYVKAEDVVDEKINSKNIMDHMDFF